MESAVPKIAQWNYIQKIYHRSNHPDWKGWTQQKRSQKARLFWETLKEDPFWKDTFVEFQDEHAIYLDQMDFWKKDARRSAIERSKRTLEEGDRENQDDSNRKQIEEDTQPPPKKKRKVIASKKPKKTIVAPPISGVITLKGDGYEVGDFALLLTEALTTEMKVRCKESRITISWFAWPSTSKKVRRIDIDISSINTMHLGAYQKWAHSKNESAFLDIKLKKGIAPKFLHRVYVRGKTESEIQFEEIEDFTRGSALKSQRHRFKIRCMANRQKNEQFVSEPVGVRSV